MAIAFDNATDGGAVGTTVTISHVVTGDSNFLVVGVVGGNISDGDLVTGVTYNGTSMSLISKQAPHNSIDRWNYLFTLTAPDTGTHDVVMSASSSIFMGGHIVSYTGVLQTGQPEVDALTTAAAETSQAPGLTTITDNSWLVSYERSSQTSSAGSGTIKRNSDATASVFDSNAALTPAGSHNLNMTAASASWNNHIIAIAPAPDIGGFMTLNPGIWGA